MNGFNNLTLGEIQTLTYIFRKEKEAEEKMTKEEKEAHALSQVLEQ